MSRMLVATGVFSQVTRMFDYLLQDIAPTTWMLIALAGAAIWILFVQPK
jgi:hypothetical protein